MNEFSRRSFLKGSAALAGTALLSTIGFSASAEEAVSAEESFNITSTEETDVVVVGMGVSGIVAMCGAADKGAKVIGLDPATGFAATNACSTAGAWAVGTKPQLACEKHLEKEHIRTMPDRNGCQRGKKKRREEFHEESNAY